MLCKGQIKCACALTLKKIEIKYAFLLKFFDPGKTEEILIR